MIDNRDDSIATLKSQSYFLEYLIHCNDKVTDEVKCLITYLNSHAKRMIRLHAFIWRNGQM